jgi:hypothetical protein
LILIDAAGEGAVADSRLLGVILQPIGKPKDLAKDALHGGIDSIGSSCSDALEAEHRSSVLHFH